MTITFRVYREPDGTFLGIVAVRLGEPDEWGRAEAMARSLWGPGEYRIEMQGID